MTVFPSPTISGAFFQGSLIKSTTGAVLSALYDWEGLLDKNLEVLVAFLDIRKAFDSVPHKCLLERLLSLDVPEHIVGLDQILSL